MPNGRAAQVGFAYLLLLAAVAIVGAAAATSVMAGASSARREAEEHLLDVGEEFERALWSYRAATAGAPSGRSPKALEELLKDPRFPGVKRHLRKLYPDPATGGSGEWGVVKAADGSVLGIYSLAAGTPIKRTGFPAHQPHFENARTYSDWVFGLPPEVRERASDHRDAR